MRLAHLAAGVSLLSIGLCVCGQQNVEPTSASDRFKADLLLVIAHPDDESEIGAYLAKAAFDEHKRIAVVFGTPGNSGGDAVGPEQAQSLAAIREIEARRALGYLGISNIWFLGGTDTAGQDVLRSLETWDHGRALGRLIRIVRLTRPSVIATWLPAYSAGENHGDHQAAGVLATEAFDAAGDPTQFPEQVTPARDPRGISNLTEGLQPWQAQKLYFFSDTSHPEWLQGKGPEYSAKQRSPAKKEDYAHLSARECSFHLTQSDSGYLAKQSLQDGTLDKTYFAQPSRFVFGKAHVDAATTGDLFQAVTSSGVRFHPAPGFRAQEVEKPTLELGGPWHFYHQFWQSHGLQQLEGMVAPEVLVGVSTYVHIPVLIEGHHGGGGNLEVVLPEGWSAKSGTGPYQANAAVPFARDLVVLAPKDVVDAFKEIRVRATLNGAALNDITLRVQVAPSNLPQ